MPQNAATVAFQTSRGEARLRLEKSAIHKLPQGKTKNSNIWIAENDWISLDVYTKVTSQNVPLLVKLNIRLFPDTAVAKAKQGRDSFYSAPLRFWHFYNEEQFKGGAKDNIGAKFYSLKPYISQEILGAMISRCRSCKMLLPKFYYYQGKLKSLNRVLLRCYHVQNILCGYNAYANFGIGVAVYAYMERGRTGKYWHRGTLEEASYHEIIQYLDKYIEKAHACAKP